MNVTIEIQILVEIGYLLRVPFAQKCVFYKMPACMYGRDIDSDGNKTTKSISTKFGA